MVKNNLIDCSLSANRGIHFDKNTSQGGSDKLYQIAREMHNKIIEKNIEDWNMTWNH